MKSTYLIALLAFVLLAASFAPGTIFAQTSSKVSPKTCLSLTSNLSYGMQDMHTDGSVARLQDFLATNGYFDRNLMGSLRFGPATRAAVVTFQAAHSIPQTGFVGPLTRAAISTVSCGTTPPSSTVSLYFISPATSTVGATVSVTGFGFTSNNTILMDGTVAARNIPITSSIAVACTTDPSCKGGIRQTLTFTIPSALSPNCPADSVCPMYMREVTPGTYSVTVQNGNGTSNALPLTVTSN
jgi:peptidoglycan hydrolase-like protein with peptidoglycan-binding domain